LEQRERPFIVLRATPARAEHQPQVVGGCEVPGVGTLPQLLTQRRIACRLRAELALVGVGDHVSGVQVAQRHAALGQSHRPGMISLDAPSAHEAHRQLAQGRRMVTLRGLLEPVPYPLGMPHHGGLCPSGSLRIEKRCQLHLRWHLAACGGLERARVPRPQIQHPVQHTIAREDREPCRQTHVLVGRSQATQRLARDPRQFTVDDRAILPHLGRECAHPCPDLQVRQQRINQHRSQVEPDEVRGLPGAVRFELREQLIDLEHGEAARACDVLWRRWHRRLGLGRWRGRGRGRIVPLLQRLQLLLHLRVLQRR